MHYYRKDLKGINVINYDLSKYNEKNFSNFEELNTFYY